MFYNYFYNYVINHLRINSAKKSLHFEIIYTKKNFVLLNIFKKLGLLRTFYLIKKNDVYKIKIFIFYYKKSPLCKCLKLLSTPSKSFYISYKALQLLHNRTQNSFYILSTTRGILTHLDALKHKIGGLLVMFVTL